MHLVNKLRAQCPTNLAPGPLRVLYVAAVLSVPIEDAALPRRQQNDGKQDNADGESAPRLSPVALALCCSQTSATKEYRRITSVIAEHICR